MLLAQRDGIFLRIRPLKLNLGVISTLITVFILQELSDYRKFLSIKPMKLNVRTISADYPSTIITEYLPNCYIRVTALSEYFDFLHNVAGAPSKMGPRANCPSCPSVKDL